MITKTASLSTDNKTLGQKIEVNIDVTVPETLAEAAEFYKGEEELIKVVQQETVRRKINAARPILRDADTEMDWVDVATQIAEQYEPGRRGGFQVGVSEDEVDSAESVEDLKALLASKGILRG